MLDPHSRRADRPDLGVDARDGRRNAVEALAEVGETAIGSIEGTLRALLEAREFALGTVEVAPQQLGGSVDL
ncbi:hypothetical protein [Sphingomonas sp. PAMC 26605]|uniref:hypothetical protein n=1 Tax=Sphingomonas sp. PAMC 26605 TaxID=1112214 RepID=UPI001E3D5FFE|nr:hypothetical protein [Sphingomonas sp. PAMC 26605]